jgi:type I restriction enzyme S subunit
VYKSAGRPFVRSQNVGWGELKLDDVAYIDDTTHMTFPATEIRTGDVLLNITGASIGRSAVATPELAGGNVNQHVCEIRLKPQVMDPYYVNAFLLSKAGQDQIDAFQAGGNRQGLNFQQVGSIELPAPPIDLQRVIGAASRDTDSLTAALERLITKKQAIKQGMMQELLTGRTRLPGFDGEWNDVSLGSIATVTMGQSPAGITYNSDSYGIPLVQGNADIRDRATFDRVWTTAPTKLCKGGDIILTVRAPVGYTAIASRASCLGRGVCALSTKADNRFLFHALVYVEPSWALYEQGSTFTAVNSNEVRSFTLRWPADADERSAIAHVLDDADDELRILELRLGKARAIKQGMMQELLTGRTRLPVQEALA